MRGYSENEYPHEITYDEFVKAIKRARGVVDERSISKWIKAFQDHGFIRVDDRQGKQFIVVVNPNPQP